MKSILTVFALTAFSVPSIQAETAVQRELQQLRDQRAKAVAAAVDPINRRYQDALAQLLRRATQGNDLETALQIKQEMAAPAGGAVGTAGAPPSSATKADESEEWLTKIIGTRWMLIPNEKRAVEFKPDGVVVRYVGNLEAATTNYKIAGKRIVELWGEYLVEFDRTFKTATFTKPSNGYSGKATLIK